MPGQLSKEHRAALEPFAMVVAGMDAALQELSYDELTTLKDACNSVSTTNCWCHTWTAANHIRAEVERLHRLAKQQESQEEPADG